MFQWMHIHGQTLLSVFSLNFFSTILIRALSHSYSKYSYFSDGIESEWRAQNDSESSASYYPSYSAWMSFGTSFIGTIIENLQVKISNVHIRYEDDFYSKVPFSFGFTLASVKMDTDTEEEKRLKQ